MWTSLDIGIKFGRPNNIRSQLDKIANGGKPRQAPRQSDFSEPSRKSSLARESFSPSSTDTKPPSQPEATDPEPPLDPTARFAALKSFYKTQLSLSSSDTDSTPTLPTAADLAYSSPSSLTRIVNLYTTLGTATSFKRPKSRAPIMREALTPAEGLLIPPPQQDPAAQSPTITHLSDTASLAQKAFQQSASGAGDPNGRLVADLRPMPALLRTKRAKRCAACRHILAKPDFKVTSTRYKIKLMALNYIPLVTLRPMAVSGAAKATLAPAAGGGGGTSGGSGAGGGALQPHRPHQWVVTLKNHLFDAVKVSLATPAVTPGRLGHRVTVLCPQFEVGANGDVWDDALGGGGGGGGDKRLSVAVAASGPKGEAGVAEAGKVYDKGRNWTSVVLEVVPVGSGAPRAKAVPKVSEKVEEQGSGESAGLQEREEVDGEDEVDEDDDVVEIPIRVRLEWRQSDAEDGDEGKKKATAAAKVNEEGEVVDEAKRELAYWMVLGVGRVGS